MPDVFLTPPLVRAISPEAITEMAFLEVTPASRTELVPLLLARSTVPVPEILLIPLWVMEILPSRKKL